MRDAKQPTRRFWSAAHPAQAIAEAWLWSFAFLFLLWQFAGKVQPQAIGNGWFALAGTAGMWTVLRTRIPNGRWWQQILRELVVGVALSITMCAGINLTIHGLHWETVWEMPMVNEFFSVILMLAIGPGFLVTRSLLRLWHYWNRLRRRRLLWTITHGHLTVVFIIMSSWALLMIILSPPHNVPAAPFQSGTFWAALLSDMLTTFFPIAMITLFGTLFMLIAVLPPSALLSFLVARKTTKRIENLTTATSELRGGNYATRVTVAGEDEVAQLQTDFNAMAAALETTLHDLAAERDKVSQLLSARQKLVASVSHELRTPVATLRGYLESTRTPDLPPETLAHNMAVMEREILRLQRLIDDLFTLSRAEVEALTLDMQPVKLDAVVQRRIEALAPLAAKREHIEMVFESPNTLPQIKADAGRLDQILTNLLRNALRHTPPGGIIVVHAEVEVATVLLEVCDTGSGITQEDLPHIWESFYRGAEARAEDQQGAGLGLALVKELSEAMGGTVAVQSTVGAGSCFSVRLPQAEPTEPK